MVQNLSGRPSWISRMDTVSRLIIEGRLMQMAVSSESGPVEGIIPRRPPLSLPKPFSRGAQRVVPKKKTRANKKWYFYDISAIVAVCLHLCLQSAKFSSPPLACRYAKALAYCTNCGTENTSCE